MKEVNYVIFCKDVDDLSDYTVQSVSADQKKDTSYTSEDVVSDISKLNMMSALYSTKRLSVKSSVLIVMKFLFY